jgi:hypothetical protein
MTLPRRLAVFASDVTDSSATEGQAQVRAPAAAHHTYWQEEEEGRWTERRREAPGRIPHRAMQAEISPNAAHP